MTPLRRSVAIAPFAAAALAAALIVPSGAAASDAPRLSLGNAAAGTAPAASVPAAPAEPAADPTLEISTFVSGLDHAWDVAFVGKRMLVTERDREKLSVRMPDGEMRTLFENPAGMWHAGETGLMGLAVDPDFADNRWVYTCNGFDNGSTKDIRVVRYQINEAWTAASEQTSIVTGIQVNSGRHGGCRLRFTPNGALYVGTGDAAVGTNPQSLTVLNGKTLRVDHDGAPWPGNPFIDSGNDTTKKIFTYGHRNVQGLAVRKGNQVWSAEHGSYRDDEVNKLKAGGNYGWNPVPGYDESVPMTDHDLPGKQIDAKWSSGTPTIATSGMTFLKGKQWRSWNGSLAVCALGGNELRIMKFDKKGELVSELSVPEFDGDFGRIRAAQMGPGGALYITTDNGGGNDRVLKVTAS